MKIKEYALIKVKSNEIGSRFVDDKRYRVITQVHKSSKNGQ